MTVADADALLRQKFEQHVLTKTDEGTMAAREFLKAVESGDKFCRPGKFGRIFQFHDPDFLPNHISLGHNLECKDRVVDSWKQSTQINHEAMIFAGGTDPDDVRVGEINDQWLLSAISMLAAAGGVDDGGLDDQIANLFVSHIGADGQPKYNSEVGAFGVRFFKNNQWEVVVVDDFFPVLHNDDESKSEMNKGSITGHSEGMQEIWVPLLEKAYAKYYGSYDVLEVSQRSERRKKDAQARPGTKSTSRTPFVVELTVLLTFTRFAHRISSWHLALHARCRRATSGTP